jgi:hypothetical protein
MHSLLERSLYPFRPQIKNEEQRWTYVSLAKQHVLKILKQAHAQAGDTTIPALTNHGGKTGVVNTAQFGGQSH